ncbi:MAG: hypothetical protein GQF41_1050 [Candidatus Rifleibacterium amylolyticum]|nr:MAG: hypothetical protein GQF41_1050 [Candidatus Rifleibacterium amylolyticum]
MNQTHRFSPLSLLAAWLFLSIPFILVLFDWSTARQRQIISENEAADRLAQTALEKMQVSTSWEYQALLQLNKFHRQLRELADKTGDADKIAACELYKQLTRSLPPHHLLIASRNPGSKKLQTTCKSSTLPGVNLLENFVPLMNKSPSQHELQTAASSLATMCNFPVNPATIIDRQEYIRNKEEGIMLPFTSVKGSTWLYWFYPDGVNDKILLCAVFETGKIPADYAYNAMVSTLDKTATGFAIIPVSGNEKPFWSPYLRHKPDLQRFMSAEAANLPMKSTQLQFGKFNIYSAPVLVGESSLIMLVTNHLPEMPLTNGETLFLIFTFITFAGLSMILLQRRIFRRGWRISIALVMVTAFFSLFYLPAGLGRLVISHSLDSHLSAILEQAESDLDKNLQRLEDRYDLAMADFFYRLSHPADNAKVIQAIEGDRSTQALEEISVSVRAKYPEPLGNSFLLMTMQQDNGQNAVWLRKGGEGDSKNASEMFAMLLKSVLHKFRPELIDKNGQTGNQLSLDEVKEEMISDFLIKFFQGVLGEEFFYRLMANPSSLVEANSSFLMVSTSGVPITIAGVVRAIILVMWSEFNESEDYLAFLRKNRGERADNFEFAAVRKGSFHGHFRSTIPITPPVWDLIERTRRVGIQLTSHEQMTAEEKLLIKTRPGKSLSLYILAGVASLKDFFATKSSLENMVNTMLVTAITLLAALVMFLYWYFMSPLKHLQRVLASISRGDFAERTALDQRTDEFGSIGRSFNTMAQGLAEGSLLGKFVSSAVIKVVKDKSAFEKAIKGEKRAMTILFASVKTGDANDAEAFIEQQAFHLKASQEAIRPTAGVIDKVMENKILVFFDHEACAGANSAVKQAIDTVFALKQQLAAQQCKGYYGLATGTVVAGIIGARNLRLDYTVIGDAVNLAARLNALAADDTGSQIIADEKTRSLLPDSATAENLGEIKIKGKTAPVAIHRLGTRA